MVMRRRRAWGDTRIAGTLLASSATLKFDLLPNLAAADTKTVSRILIDLTVGVPVNNDSSVDRENVVDVGIGVVSNEAFIAETLPDMDAVADYPQAGWVYLATKPVTKMAGNIATP